MIINQHCNGDTVSEFENTFSSAPQIGNSKQLLANQTGNNNELMGCSKGGVNCIEVARQDNGQTGIIQQAGDSNTVALTQ